MGHPAGGFAWWGLGGVAAARKAIWSLRLRLHSGLRQRGRRLRRWLVYGPAEAVPFRVVCPGLGRRRGGLRLWRWDPGLRPWLAYFGPLALGWVRAAGGFAWRGWLVYGTETQG